MVNMVTGNKPQILLDKMAERLAMERTATRLYDALLVKVDALHEGRGTISREQVAGIRGDEHRHALLMRDAIAALGGDPTAMTPSADLVGVEAMGLVQVLSDPRTSMAQSGTGASSRAKVAAADLGTPGSPGNPSGGAGS